MTAAPHPRSIASFLGPVSGLMKAPPLLPARGFSRSGLSAWAAIGRTCSETALHRLRDAFTYRCGEQHSLATVPGVARGLLFPV